MHPLKISIKEILVSAAKKQIERKIKIIQTSGIKNKKYKKTTIYARKKHSLQTMFIDLTGNNKYSKKSWRLFESWHIEIIDEKNVSLVWNFEEAKTLYGFQIKRFGKIL